MFRNWFKPRSSEQAQSSVPAPYREVEINRRGLLEVLSLFDTPSAPERRVFGEWETFWEAKLGAPFIAVVDRLLDEGWLQPANAEERLYEAFSVADLKELAKSRGLMVKGRKHELAKRIAESASPEQPLELPKRNVLICSKEAMQLVADYKSANKKAKEQAITETLKALQLGEFKRAVDIVCDFEATRFFPQGMGVSIADNKENRVRELQFIHTATPQFHQLRFGGVSKPTRLAASLSLLWGTERFNALAFEATPYRRGHDDIAARMLLFHCNHERSLNSVREFSKGQTQQPTVEISVVRDNQTTCEACIADAEKEYDAQSAPELPHARCTCAIGCRCGYLPKLHFDYLSV